MEKLKKEIKKELSWILPEGIRADEEISELNDSQLDYFHEQMHVFWERVLEGFQFGWGLHQIYEAHRETVLQMMSRGMIHLSPINSLDNIPIAEDSEELKKLIKKVKKYE